MQKCDFNKTTLQPYNHTLCIGTDVTIIKKIVILLKKFDSFKRS